MRGAWEEERGGAYGRRLGLGEEHEEEHEVEPRGGGKGRSLGEGHGRSLGLGEEHGRGKGRTSRFLDEVWVGWREEGRVCETRDIVKVPFCSSCC